MVVLQECQTDKKSPIPRTLILNPEGGFGVGWCIASGGGGGGVRESSSNVGIRRDMCQIVRHWMESKYWIDEINIMAEPVPLV